MNADPLLNKAIRLAKKRDYEGALKVLKYEEDRYYGSFNYYYLYAVICLHSGSFEEAQENFKLARKIKIKDPSTMLGIAVHYLRHMRTGQAVDYYLDVQEMQPKNKIAKRALYIIRKHCATEALSDWMTPDRLAKLFPPIPGSSFSIKKLINHLLIFSAVLVFSCMALTWLNIIPNPFNRQNMRPSADFILSSQERNEPVQVEGFYRYILTRDQAINLYDRALSHFTNFRDEAAKIYLNRILESNASEGIKNRARLLFDNMEVPGFDNFKMADNPAFSDVKNEPFIYRDVHVIWRGMATNIEITDESTKFDFLVGYDTRRTLDGIIPVVFYSPVSINSQRPLEVLGKITLAPSYSEIVLEGVAIHQSGRLEN
jgi:tetratricopeptide (TPR) repeat protein